MKHSQNEFLLWCTRSTCVFHSSVKIFPGTIIGVVWCKAADILTALKPTFNSKVRRVSWSALVKMETGKKDVWKSAWVATWIRLRGKAIQYFQCQTRQV